ncbi:replicative DNA helicase [Pseudoclavibacter helvolus]|uniref:replicative DNA helicase n=1 Tax=Pseudoclavibacter helvolus TaxID=255205 RepID=UPI0035EA361E
MTVLHNEEAERSVLGAVMLHPDAIWEVRDVLSPADFHDPKLEVVAAAIWRLTDRSEPCDVIAVSQELVADHRVDVTLVHDLAGGTPTWVNADYWAGIVREDALRRKLVESAARIGGLASDGTPAAEAIDAARAIVDAIGNTDPGRAGVIGDSFGQWLNDLHEQPRYVATPWWDINELVGGLRATTLTVIGARPGQGKSVVGLQLALELAKVGDVAFVSLEMSRDDIMNRLVAQLANVPLGALVNHQVSQPLEANIHQVAERIRSLPIHVATSDEVQTLAQVKAYARSVAREAARAGRQFAGVVVDYLQLMTSGGQVESRQVEVAGFSRALKMLAQDLDAPIIALAQLNRGNQKLGTKARKPQLSDLRESGAIEQDADVVLLLHRDERDAPHDLEVIVAKNRHGKQGTATLDWQGQFARALSREWDPTRFINS